MKQFLLICKLTLFAMMFLFNSSNAQYTVNEHDPIAEEIVNAELDLVLTRDKPIADALNDAGAMIDRRARR
jgi:hypothetical protein